MMVSFFTERPVPGEFISMLPLVFGTGPDNAISRGDCRGDYVPKQNDPPYDPDPLDQKLAAQGVELISPHRNNRSRAPTQDGRRLRRYRRRWKVERLFAWLNKFKRVIARYDRCEKRYTALVYLACSMILLRRYL